MTKDSYLEGIALIEKQYKEAKSQLGRQYAYANNTVKEGDVISDHTNTIKIDKIQWGIPFGKNIPECVFSGPCLTKKGEPYKNGDRAQIWQHNIKQS